MHPVINFDHTDMENTLIESLLPRLSDYLLYSSILQIEMHLIFV